MKKHYNKILGTLVLLIVLLTSTIFATPRIKAKYDIWKIQKENDQTMALINAMKIDKPISSTKLETNNEPTIDNQLSDEMIELNTEKIERSLTATPEQHYLEVEFICQAPLQTEANWAFHEESCEEAALLMAYLYEKEETVSREEANEIILEMIAWQNENFGGHLDLYADELKEFAVGFYDIDPEKITIIRNASIEDIKKEISSDHAVVVPITGELLKNPYYPYPGYHMLTVTGYTEERIITNDNGTRHGEDFSYDIEVFEAAMKDTGGDILILDL